jgi:hypothetical protein
VVLSAGWSGDRVLVRLLSATGGVRMMGHVLGRPVPDPGGHLRRAVASQDGRIRGAVVLPHHLWLVNELDAVKFVASLVADGIVVVTLARRSAEDRGLSLALCGPVTEVLPSAPRQIDAGDVALYAQQSDDAVTWFEQVRPNPADRFVFEDDLLSAESRQESVRRVAERLQLPPWDAPPDAEIPDGGALWGLVANAEDVRAHLTYFRTTVHG